MNEVTQMTVPAAPAEYHQSQWGLPDRERGEVEEEEEEKREMEDLRIIADASKEGISPKTTLGEDASCC